MNCENENWKKTKKKQQNKILNFYIQRERTLIKTIIDIFIIWGWMACFIMGSLSKILIMLGITVAVVWILRYICSSSLSIRYSRVGRELQKYGELKEVKKDVEEQAKHALYCSGDQAITEKYLILSVPVQEWTNLTGNGEGLCLISTSEIEKIQISEKFYGDGDEAYTMFFTTFAGEQWKLTVWKPYKEVYQIKKRLEACRDQGIGPTQKSYGYKNGGGSARKKQFMDDAAMEKRRMRAEQKRKKRERILSGKTASTVQECYKKKKKICIAIYIVFLSIFAIGFGWGMWMERDHLGRFFHDLYRDREIVSLVASMYLLPMLLVYAYIFWMERQVLRQYRRLKYFEQQEMDRQIVESAEIKMGDVIYGKRCFWFRDFRHFCLHNLIFYEDVVWVYLSTGRMQPSMQGVDMPVLHLHNIVFYTRDGKKHSIYMGNASYFSRYFPKAIKGYGREQKQEYKELRRKL